MVLFRRRPDLTPFRSLDVTLFVPFFLVFLQVVENGSKNIEIVVLKPGELPQSFPEADIETIVKEIERAREEDVEVEDEEEKVADEGED